MARAPRRWDVSLGAVLVLAVLFALHSLLRAAISADLVAAPGWLQVTVLSFAVPLALFASYVVWANVTKGIVEGYGGVVAVVRNWALSCGLLVLLVSYLLPAKTPAAIHAVRAVAGLLFVVGLLISRAKLQRWLNEPAAGTEQPQPAPRPVNPLLPPVQTKPQDWDASVWDPDIQADIERRRHS